MQELKSYGTIQKIEEVHDVGLPAISPLEGENGARLGLSQMLCTLTGGCGMDGYRVTTEQCTVLVLIDNGQSCCESWGYFASEDDTSKYVGAVLKEVRLTDTALHQEHVEEAYPFASFGFDGGGIQFVDFVTDRGLFQLSVYNAHNGYYGHGILIVRDNEVLLNNTL